VGAAWDVFGDGKTSLRGGYGISFERNFGNVTYNVLFNPPAFGIASQRAGDFGMPFFPLYTDDLGPFSGTGLHTVPRLGLRTLRADLHTGFAETWSVSAEHQLFGNTLAAAEYTGSKGVDLYHISNVNRPLSGAVYLGLPGPGDPDADPSNFAARLNAQYAEMNERGNDGESIYHAMTLRVASRSPGDSGLYVNASYTWGHAIDNLSDTFSTTNPEGLGFLDAFNPDIDRGNAAFDIRHRFVTNGVWDVPFARDLEGWKKRALDGWSFSFIYTAQTGLPFDVYDCSGFNFAFCPRVSLTAPVATSGPGDPPPVDAAHDPNYMNAGNTNVYIDLLPLINSGSVGYFRNPLTTRYVQYLFGPDAYNSEFGPFPSNMAGRNLFRGPGNWNLDGSVHKQIELTQTTHLELRFEFFDLFNHANLYAGSTDISTSYFVSAFRAGHRVVQMGVKLIF
jgi:hypothetical protein